MNIKKITNKELISMSKDNDYLVWQGCGGPLEDWYTGITNLMIENDIAKKDYKMTEMYVFNNNGTTCLITPLDNLNLSKLAIMRLMWRPTFGTMWLSDYISNDYI